MDGHTTVDSNWFKDASCSHTVSYTCRGCSALRHPVPRALPDGRNIDGRPVWEPPILNYSNLIGEEYEKKREAVLKFYHGDVVRATSLLDTENEYLLLHMFRTWTGENRDHAEAMGDWESRQFFRGLWGEVFHDFYDLEKEQIAVGFTTEKQYDDTYKVRIYNPAFRPVDRKGRTTRDHTTESGSWASELSGDEEETTAPVQLTTFPPFTLRPPPPPPFAFLIQCARRKDTPTESVIEWESESGWEDESEASDISDWGGVD